jgi:hypothetical protein
MNAVEVVAQDCELNHSVLKSYLTAWRKLMFFHCAIDVLPESQRNRPGSLFHETGRLPLQLCNQVPVFQY